MTESKFYRHGPIECRKCFPVDLPVRWYETRWEFGVRPDDCWQLVNSPLYAGSSDPLVLVLGFSKGPNQMKPGTPFDDIPFKGGRYAVTTILRTLGLLADRDTVDRHISGDEPTFGFASLVRCSIGRWEEKRRRFESSGGNILVRAVTSPKAEAVIENCMEAGLKGLPPRLRLIVMLGNDEEYIAQCCKRVRAIHKDVRMLDGNAMAYGNDRVRWVHAIHFKAQGGLVDEWAGLRPCTHGQPRKRELAVAAVRSLSLAL